jgi:hypothetical protein
MNTAVALSAGQDGLFQDFLPSNNPHLTIVELDAVYEGPG